MRSVAAVFAVLAAVSVISTASAATEMQVAAADPVEAIDAVRPDVQHQALDAALPPAVARDGGETAEAPAAALPPPQPTLFASIDLSKQTMTVSDKNGVIASWKISSGRHGHLTPTGTHTPHYTARMHYSKQYYNSPMPYSVFFNRGIAVHGTNDLRNLGRPASHGCIRSHPKNAKVFYDLVQKHGREMTRVTVHGKVPASSAPAVARKQQQQRYAQPQQWNGGGLFGYSQQAPKAKAKAKGKQKQQYGGGGLFW
ncbi:L,D-transpeptidase [Hyphomicrobium sp. D-2]|uniref:L,D-transpeptidase n=1 Tax=Hyphomicrobium sp. D-2 TaxID=3041621 RepID=UPI002457723B|nr:L,D-transpeptidase [Hyphomicrobium sp. D-2]MDH4982823.1 L,D-transpeptidase [Hyphomicrobium sp. D-2]